jgi:hypothetical protein
LVIGEQPKSIHEALKISSIIVRRAQTGTQQLKQSAQEQAKKGT